MDFSLSDKAEDYLGRLQTFFDKHIFPKEKDYDNEIENSHDPLHIPNLLNELKVIAKNEKRKKKMTTKVTNFLNNLSEEQLNTLKQLLDEENPNDKTTTQTKQNDKKRLCDTATPPGVGALGWRRCDVWVFADRLLVCLFVCSCVCVFLFLKVFSM